MSIRTEKQRKERAKKRAEKEARMKQPGAKSKYALKNRQREIARGYSTRPTSPFFLPESQRGNEAEVES